MENITVALGGDHAGFEYKQVLIKHLEERNIVYKDFGPFNDQSVDYPDYVHPLCKAVEAGDFTFGVLICGSGNGVAIAANKHQHIRAALCWNTELAKLARRHNNANALCLPARFVSSAEAVTMMDAFINADFEGGRHTIRVNKIPC